MDLDYIDYIFIWSCHIEFESVLPESATGGATGGGRGGGRNSEEEALVEVNRRALVTVRYAYGFAKKHILDLPPGEVMMNNQKFYFYFISINLV